MMIFFLHQFRCYIIKHLFESPCNFYYCLQTHKSILNIWDGASNIKPSNILTAGGLCGILGPTTVLLKHVLYPNIQQTKQCLSLVVLKLKSKNKLLISSIEFECINNKLLFWIHILFIYIYTYTRVVLGIFDFRRRLKLMQINRIQGGINVLQMYLTFSNSSKQNI